MILNGRTTIFLAPDVIVKKLGLSGATVGPAGPPGAAGAPGTPGSAGGTTSILAAENIGAFSVVTSTGKNADSSLTAHIGKIVGISNTAINNGFTGDVVSSGQVTNPAWSWTRGDVLFINGTSISTSAPATGFVQIIGTASAADTIVVEIEPAILL